VTVNDYLVHTFVGQGIQVHRQGGHQGLAFAGAHLGNLALVQGQATDQLHVEVTHLQRALAGFTHDSKGLGQELIQRATGRQACAEFIGLRAHLGVRQFFVLGF
jgi:hypothetical protein